MKVAIHRVFIKTGRVAKRPIMVIDNVRNFEEAHKIFGLSEGWRGYSQYTPFKAIEIKDENSNSP
jgi:hypothetical protein